MLKRGGGKDNPTHFLLHEIDDDQNQKQERQQDDDDDQDKLFSGACSNKLLSKQLIMSVEPSFRILYYGGASGSVPFTWESQPGTPKHPSSDASLPPLTPPPSYLSRDKSVHRDLKRSKSSFLRAIFSGRKSSHVSPSFSWSSSSGSSGSYSSPSTPMNWPLVKRSRQAVPFAMYEEEGDKVVGDDQVHAARNSGTCSSSSTLCFGVRDGVSRKFQGGRRMKRVRNALMSIVGHYSKA